ncbi:hypothetical protein D3C77_407900 [compost metagenome]
MRLPWLREQIRSISRSQGRISRSLFDRIEIPLPPIERQREILALLHKVPTTRLYDAFEKATSLTQAMYREGFAGQLSRRWRESNTEVSALVSSVRSLLPANAGPDESCNPALRIARRTIAEQLSVVQFRVWALLCDRRHPLLIDDPDAVAAFCQPIQAEINFTPVALQRALKQLSALGLIRHMSIPTAGSTFMPAFRRCRVDDSGRSGEDSARRDAQLFRDSIEAPDQGL